MEQAELAQDPLVQALVPDPAGRPPDAIVLRGYLGQSTQPGRWRLYLTPVLDCFVEVPDDKVLHAMRLSEDRGTAVWVPKDLTLPLHHPQPARIHTGFLDGSIIASYPAAPVLNPYLRAATPLRGHSTAGGPHCPTDTTTGNCHCALWTVM